MTPPELKNALRASLKELREELSARDPDAGEALAERFPERLLQRFGPVVAAYWPIGSEIDPRPLIARLRSLGATIALPRVEADGLTFRIFEDAVDLEPARFGLMEPTEDAVAVRPTLILVPLLGFDGAGNRLGYGQGHYDRAVENLRADGRVFLCGLAFDNQRVEELPAEAHDQPLDWIVTPTGNLPLFLARASGATADD